MATKKKTEVKLNDNQYACLQDIEAGVTGLDKRTVNALVARGLVKVGAKALRLTAAGKKAL